LDTLEHDHAQVGLAIINDKEMAQLNEKYRKKKGSTNILAFPGEPPFLGDIAISSDTAKKEAKECGFSLEEMFDFYIIHGLLHLLGYDINHPKREELTKHLWQVLGHDVR